MKYCKVDEWGMPTSPEVPGRTILRIASWVEVLGEQFFVALKIYCGHSESIMRLKINHSCMKNIRISWSIQIFGHFIRDAPRMNSDTVRGITELGMCQDNKKHNLHSTNLQPPQSSDIYFPSSFIQPVCLFWIPMKEKNWLEFLYILLCGDFDC